MTVLGPVQPSEGTCGEDVNWGPSEGSRGGERCVPQPGNTRQGGCQTPLHAPWPCCASGPGRGQCQQKVTFCVTT